MEDVIQPQFSYNVDAHKVAEYFLSLDAQREEPDVTQMKLHKLLYLAQGNYLASTGHRLMDSDVEAFDHGPVIESVRRTYSAYGRNIIVANRNDNPTPELPLDLGEFLDRIWDLYRDYSASSLRHLSHSQAPWQESYARNTPHCVISDEEMARYFSDEVPIEQRVFHPNVVLIQRDFLDTLDDDTLAEKALEALL